ncbi:MAG: RidA family protein [Kofleriaceae bacterium]
MGIDFINPDGLGKNPAFSQLAVTSGAGRTIYIGGQNGKGDLAAQTTQALANIDLACAATSSTAVKVTIYLVHGQDLRVAFGAAQPWLRTREHPPVVTVLQVAALANPDFLVEIEAIAFG